MNFIVNFCFSLFGWVSFLFFHPKTKKKKENKTSSRKKLNQTNRSQEYLFIHEEKVALVFQSISVLQIHLKEWN